MFYLLIYARKKNLIMAFRNVKIQKHRISSFSIQRAEINWPSYYPLYRRKSSFLSPSPPHPSPPLLYLTAKMGLGRMLKSSQDVLSRGCAISGMTSATQEVFCSVGIFISYSADIVSVD